MIFPSFLATRGSFQGRDGAGFGAAGAGQEVTLVRCSIEESLIALSGRRRLHTGCARGRVLY
jgi:hypothetical protein